MPPSAHRIAVRHASNHDTLGTSLVFRRVEYTKPYSSISREMEDTPYLYSTNLRFDDGYILVQIRPAGHGVGWEVQRWSHHPDSGGFGPELLFKERFRSPEAAAERLERAYRNDDIAR